MIQIKIILVGIILNLCFGLSAQNTKLNNDEVILGVYHDSTMEGKSVAVDPKMADVYVMVDEKAYFKSKDNSDNSLHEYVRLKIKEKNIQINENCFKTVMLNFVVEKDGTVSNIKLISKECEKRDIGIIDVIKNTSKKWVPAKIKGENVRSHYYLVMKV